MRYYFSSGVRGGGGFKIDDLLGDVKYLSV